MKNKTFTDNVRLQIVLLGALLFFSSVNALIVTVLVWVTCPWILLKLFCFVLEIGIQICLVRFTVIRLSRNRKELLNIIEHYKSPEGNAHTEQYLLEEVKQLLSSLDSMTLKEKNAEILMKNAEINNLQDQINPHFLYNTLEVIRGEALMNGDRKIARMTASLANYFRYNISRKDSFVYLKDELKNIRNYFTIQQNRFGDKISLHVLFDQVDEEIIGTCYIPKLILQPIVENSIYHGLELKMGSGTITIHVTAAGDQLFITIIDDGLGIPPTLLSQLNSKSEDKPQENDRHNGVALENIKKRLDLYWGDQAHLIFSSEQGIGTEVHLMMPLQFEHQEYMDGN